MQQTIRRDPTPQNDSGGTGGVSSPQPTKGTGRPIDQGANLEQLKPPAKQNAESESRDNKGSQRSVRRETQAQAVKVPTFMGRMGDIALDYIRPLRDVQALVADIFRKPGDVKSTGGLGSYLKTIGYDLYAIGAGTAMAGLFGGGACLLTLALPSTVCVGATLLTAGLAYREFSKHVRKEMAKSLGPDNVKKTFIGRNGLLPLDEAPIEQLPPGGGRRKGNMNISTPKGDQETGGNSVGGSAVGLGSVGHGGPGGGIPRT